VPEAWRQFGSRSSILTGIKHKKWKPVTDSSGQTLPFTTMWMSAYVGGFGGDPTLEITILDFRILWADQATLNREPREAAEDSVRF
jgi:hypothetical protein